MYSLFELRERERETTALDSQLSESHFKPAPIFSKRPPLWILSFHLVSSSAFMPNGLRAPSTRKPAQNETRRLFFVLFDMVMADF